MEKLFSLVMYVLWTATIVAVLSTTFTDFKYEDLNIMAGVLLAFSILNSIFMVQRRRQR